MSPPRRGRSRRLNISELQWAFLNDALDWDDPRRFEAQFKWRFYELFCNRTLGDGRPIVDELWAEYGPAIVKQWAAEKPGTRPSLWWKYDAPEPRRPRESQAAYLKRHRLLLPGEGKPARITAS